MFSFEALFRAGQSLSQNYNSRPQSLSWLLMKVPHVGECHWKATGDMEARAFSISAKVFQHCLDLALDTGTWATGLGNLAASSADSAERFIHEVAPWHLEDGDWLLLASLHCPLKDSQKTPQRHGRKAFFAISDSRSRKKDRCKLMIPWQKCWRICRLLWTIFCFNEQKRP